MIVSRWKHIFGMSGGSLVACGGYDSVGLLKQCEKYDQGQDSWVQVAETLEEDKGFFRSVQLDNNRHLG